MKIKTVVIVLVAVLVLAACTSSKSKAPRVNYQNFIDQYELKSVNKITRFRMMRWQALNHQFFIINATQNRNFLIEVMGYCPDLQYGHTLRLVQSMSSSLQSKFDSVIVDSDPNQKCTIKNIYSLSKEQKELLTSGEVSGGISVKTEM